MLRRELNDALDAMYEAAKDGKKKDRMDALQQQVTKLMAAQAERAANAGMHAHDTHQHIDSPQR